MKKLLSLVFFTIVGFGQKIYSQCTHSVTASANPTLICGTNGTTTLTGNTSANSSDIFEAFWTPAGSVTNPNNPTTTATVSAPTTFTYTVKALTTNDVIVNGDFENGNSGFTSGYGFLPPTPSPAWIIGGVYTVLTSPSVVSSNFPPCSDHTTGSGQFMFVNSINNTGNIWCQTVSINPTSDYVWEFFINGIGIVSAQLNVTIDGTFFNTYVGSAPGTGGCSWTGFSDTWVNPGLSSVEICIENFNSTVFGPVFGLDDISFTEICTETDDVFVDLIAVETIIMTPDEINCLNQDVTIDGSNSTSGPNITYQWTTTNGSFNSATDGNTVVVNSGGQYTLMTTFDDGISSCSDSKMVTVIEDTNQPAVNAAIPAMIDCNNLTIQLDGTGSETGGGIEYLWTTPDGNILFGENTLMPTVDAAGDYQLLVTNTFNFCKDSITISVFENIDLPDVAGIATGDITCAQPTVQVDGSGSSTGGNFTYEWTTLDGTIDSGNNSIAATVSSSGTYQLLVINTFNNCRDSIDVTVNEFFDFPDVFAQATDIITCINNEVIIDASGSSTGSNFQYIWRTNDGNFVSGINSLFPVVNRSGTYELVVVNTDNQCRDSTTVFVDEDKFLPDAIGQALDEINCTDAFVVIDGTFSSQGPEFEYLWTTTNGNIQSGEDSLEPQVTKQGDYKLVVTNTDNGCKDSTVVFVNASSDFPSAIITVLDSLTCQNTLVVLNGSTSSGANPISFEWLSPNGNIISPADSTFAIVDTAGTYKLIVTDVSNNCIDSTDVEVRSNINFPTVSTLPVDSIDCANLTVQINAMGSSHDSIYQFNWRTDNGRFLSGDTTLMPVVDTIGDYWLTVIDTTNQCADSLLVSVTGNTDKPQISVGPPLTFSCNSDSVQLLANANAIDTSYQYQWGAVTGDLLSGRFTLTPWVASAGKYLIFVFDTTNNCQTVDTAFVNADTDLPIALIQTADTLTCLTNQVQLNANGSDMGTNFTFNWETPDGNFVNGTNGLQPTVDETGTYILNIENTQNGCTNLASMEIFEKRDTPIIFIPTPDTITCLNSTVDITSFGSTQGGTISTVWSTSDGSITTNPTLAGITVDSAGIYTVEITDNTNGCSRREQVEIIALRDLPQIDLIDQDTINCVDTQISLSANVQATGTNLNYQWQTSNGNIVSSNNENITLDTDGNYVLTVLDNVSGCVAKDSITIINDSLEPFVSFQAPDSINCNADPVTLDASFSSQGTNFTFTWSTATGNFMSGTNSLMPTVNQSGTYILNILNTENQCSSVDSIEVFGNSSLPLASISLSGTDTLNCFQPTITATTLSGNFSYNWQNATNPIPGNWTNEALIENPGTVIVTITDNDTGCSGTNSVEIFSDFAEPQAEAGDTKELSCTVDTLVLDGIGSIGSEFSYQWTSPNGNFVRNQDQLNPTVDATGWYYLTIQNTQNGCLKIDSVEITASLDRPNGFIALPDTFTCVNQTIQLDATGTDTGNNIQYQWTTANGNILSGATGLMPTVDQPGNYVLEILDTDNNCEGVAAIEIPVDTLAPLANAGRDTVLNCYAAQIDLDGSLSDSNPNLNFNWQTTNGNILQNGNTLSPTIDSEGTYELTILNTKNGCVASASVNVSEDFEQPNSMPAPAPSMTCADSILMLEASFDQMLTNYNFDWTTATGRIVSNQNNTAEINLPGEYQLVTTLLSSGCTDTLNFTVDDQRQLPNLQLAVLQNIDCQSNTALISTAGSDSGTGLMYVWSGTVTPTANTDEFTATTAGTYILSIDDPATGCTAIDSIQVLVDTARIALTVAPIDTLNCNDRQITITTNADNSNALFTWTTLSGNILNGSQTNEIEVDQPGEYFYSVLNPDNNCITEGSIEVIQNSNPPMVAIEPPMSLTCEVTEVQIDATNSSAGGQYAIEWQTTDGNIMTGSNGLEPKVNAVGTYALTITNIFNGCATTDSVTINEIPNTLVDIMALVMNPDCLDSLGTIQFDGIMGGFAPFEYSIDDGGSFSDVSIFEDLPEGDYDLMVRDSNGCTFSDAVVIEPIKPFDVSLIDEITIQQGSNQQIEVQTDLDPDAISSIEWTPADGLSCSDCLNPTVTGKEEIEYTVVVRDTNQCEAFATIRILVTQSDEINIFVPAAFSPNEDGDNDIFTIYAPQGLIAKINYMRIFDRWGTMIYELNDAQPDQSVGWNGTYRNQDVNAGVYVYAIEVELADGTKEFLKGDLTILR